MNENLTLEVCCYSVESVQAAALGGAQRVELCASPQEGGTTPSYASIELARGVPGIGVYVIIRPRGGDFCYSGTEFNVMKRDIEVARSLGADGVVIGILKPDGKVDIARCRELAELATPMDITFHRAFDMTSDHFQALDDIYETGIRRVLSSGTRNTVNEGMEILAKLVKHTGSDLSIMAGSGVRLNNLEELYHAGILEFHSSAAKTQPSSMQYRNPHIHMGKEGTTDEYAISMADAELIKAMRQRLDQLTANPRR